MDHVGTTWALERCYHDKIGLTRDENKYGKNESKGCVIRPKILPIRLHERDDRDDSYTKGKTNGVKFQERKFTEGYETLEVACVKWEKRVESFKTRRNTAECGKGLLDRRNEFSRDLDDTCRSWIQKVQDHNLKWVERERNRTNNTQLNRMEDEDSGINLKLKFGNEECKKVSAVVESVEEPKGPSTKKWISKSKVKQA